ncbi:hypothetical protein BJX62DRAFT_144840 [Aspergillus germanicus]
MSKQPKSSSIRASSMLPRDVADAMEHADRQRLELAGIVCFSQVFKIPDTGLVIKRADDHPITGNLEPTEKRIHEPLGHHPRLIFRSTQRSDCNGRSKSPKRFASSTPRL